jgi:hypothetical protein
MRGAATLTHRDLFNSYRTRDTCMHMGPQRRFASNPRVYRNFLNILRTYRVEQRSINEVPPATTTVWVGQWQRQWRHVCLMGCLWHTGI